MIYCGTVSIVCLVFSYILFKRLDATLPLIDISVANVSKRQQELKPSRLEESRTCPDFCGNRISYLMSGSG
jgi:hypothetical protein